MEHLDHLIQAHNNNFLWPTIADTVDTFLRRKERKAASYECIWRLVHIWEATEVTLAAVAVSKIASERASDDLVFRKCREYFYGMSWNQVDNDFRTSSGAVDGSIDQWINILNEISKDTTLNEEDFLKSLKEFLNAEQMDLRRLGYAWNKACDVPNDKLQKDKMSTKQAMRLVNSFRNRFAHVPFPHDPLSELAIALEDVTAQLFSIPPYPSQHYKQELGGSSPLTGAFACGNFLLRGTLHLQSNSKCEENQFHFPTLKNSKDKFEQKKWKAADLIYVDEMMRPHIIAKMDRETILKSVREP